jgi:hypothetical protein
MTRINILAVAAQSKWLTRILNATLYSRHTTDFHKLTTNHKLTTSTSTSHTIIYSMSIQQVLYKVTKKLSSISCLMSTTKMGDSISTLISIPILMGVS